MGGFIKNVIRCLNGLWHSSIHMNLIEFFKTEKFRALIDALKDKSVEDSYYTGQPFTSLTDHGSYMSKISLIFLRLASIPL